MQRFGEALALISQGRALAQDLDPIPRSGGAIQNRRSKGGKMAHLVDSLAWSGQVPWHGLGTRLPENVTGEDMVRVAGLDWNVIPKPLFAGLDEATGYGASVPGFKALVRGHRPHLTLS